MSSLFKSFKNFFSRSVEESVEESLDEFLEPADSSVSPSELRDVPLFTALPDAMGDAEYYAARAFSDDEGREVQHLDVRYRQEHEPYRFEPDSDMNVCVTTAYIYEIHPKGDGKEVTLHELDKNIIKVTDDCVVYSKFGTDEHGQINTKYTLHVEEGDQFGAEVPASTYFKPPGELGGGIDGEYHIPLFWVKEGKLERNFWNDEEEDARQVQLWGGLYGHRGPFWWIRGYNVFKNKSSYKQGVDPETGHEDRKSKNIYKEYNIGLDQHRLRTLNSKDRLKESGGSDDQGNPVVAGGADDGFTGKHQIQVEYEGLNKDDNDAQKLAAQIDANEIHIWGNEYDKWFKVGGKKVGKIEDGLVSCFGDLDCLDLATTTPSVATVYTSYKSVAECPDSDNKYTDVLRQGSGSEVGVWSAGTTSNQIWYGGSANPNMITGATGTIWIGGSQDSNMISGDTGNVWSGGSSNTSMITGTPTSNMYQGGGLQSLTYHKVEGADGTGEVWALGVAASGSYETSGPSDLSIIQGASVVSGVTDCSTVSGIVGAGITTGVVDATKVQGLINQSSDTGVTGASVVQGVVGANLTTGITGSEITTVSVYKDAETCTVIKDLDCVNAVTTETSVNVYQAASPVPKFLTEATDSTSENDKVKVVKCPEKDLCPKEEEA
tara:strand:+ start:9685 stop:11670 length:1986 start_codon:yes stop_codon:yes gene_type:complete